MRTVASGSMIRTGEMELRKSFSCLAAGVAVIAVRGARGTPSCVVASSFNSVSLAPPLLLWCAPARDLAALGLQVNSACGISVLSSSQSHLAEPGRCGPEGHWESGDSLGVPLLARAAATFEVVITRCLPQGTDILCFAEVARFGYRPGQPGALLFAERPADFVPIA